MITSTNFGMSTHVGPPWPLTGPSNTYKNKWFLQGLARSGLLGHFKKKKIALTGPRAPQGEIYDGISTPTMRYKYSHHIDEPLFHGEIEMNTVITKMSYDYD